MVLSRYVGEIQFAGRHMLLKFRMEFEQIQCLLEGLLKMFNNYTRTFLELIIFGKFNVVGISGVVLAVLAIFGVVPRRKSSRTSFMHWKTSFSKTERNQQQYGLDFRP